MSHLRTNLQYLRAQKGMSQSQLAARLDVSRQSVAKWEAEKSYPEMEKLIKICEIFECSMDELVRGDLASSGSGEDEGGIDRAAELSPRAQLEADAAQEGTPARAEEGCSWSDYDAFVKRRAGMLSSAIFLLFGGLSADFFTQAVQADLNGGANQLGPMLLLVAMGCSLALALWAKRSRESFILKNTSVQEPVGEEKTACVSRKRAVFLSLALSAAVVLAPSILPGLDEESAYASSAYWLFGAAAAGLVVNSWVRGTALDVDRYNRVARRFVAKRYPDREG